MTAKSETVSVDSVWIKRVDVGTDNECWFVCNLLDPGAVEFVPKSALAAADARYAGLYEIYRNKIDERERIFNFAKQLRALIPAAANTESEETNEN